jgi:competence protein CoiA
MQLYALDSNNDIIFAGAAQKQHDYRCPECKKTVRVRGGPQRQHHFFHLSASPHCSHNNKTLEHLLVQLHIQHLIGKEDCSLEVRFPSISRIADVVWSSHHLIFEVQCSHISTYEILQRVADYRREGYEVIWILHDARFRRDHLSREETLLSSLPHYYTNIDASGRGNIYDIFSFVHGGRKIFISEPFSVDLSRPYHLPPFSSRPPSYVAHRHAELPFSFHGDILWHYAFDRERLSYLFSLMDSLEARYYSQEQGRSWYGLSRHFFMKYVARPYRIMLLSLLEKLCK